MKRSTKKDHLKRLCGWGERYTPHVRPAGEPLGMARERNNFSNALNEIACLYEIDERTGNVYSTEKKRKKSKKNGI